MSLYSPEFENPAELGVEYARNLGGWEFEVSHDEKIKLIQLEKEADRQGFLGESYFVETSRAFALPHSFDSREQVSYFLFDRGLSFEGRLGSFALVRIGRILGVGAVRGVCLMFDKATMLPFFDNLNEEHLLYTPVHSINSMSCTSS